MRIHKTALIFRYALLGISETFIQAQAGALAEFRPCYAGVQRAKPSLPIADDSIILMSGTSVADRISRRAFLSAGWAPGFYREISERNPVILHAHFAPDAAAALPLASHFEIPLIATLHGYDVTSSEASLKRSHLGRLLLRRKHALFGRAKLFLCVSEFIRKKAIEAGYPEHKLRVHYIGVDRELFRPNSGERERNLVLFVGRLIEQKGCRHLIEAMHLVQQKRPDTRLVMIGEGTDRAAFEALARERGIRCEFLGARPPETVRNWLSSAQVFCVPSVTGSNGAQEALGMVFAEAQAMGVPVVSFRNGGISEVVRDGETGLLAAEGDQGALADHLLRYLSDEPFRYACSRRAVEWIGEQFDLRKQTRLLETFYREAEGMSACAPAV